MRQLLTLRGSDLARLGVAPDLARAFSERWPHGVVVPLERADRATGVLSIACFPASIFPPDREAGS